MVCDVGELISENPCLSALNPFMLKILIVGQLCGIKNFLESAEPISCDIQTILDDSACFYGLTEFELDVITSALLCDISGLL
jgi:hypothetical protein